MLLTFYIIKATIIINQITIDKAQIKITYKAKES